MGDDRRMNKPTKQQRKLARNKFIQTQSEIPNGYYCSTCNFRAFTPPKTDYINDIKIKRRLVWCRLLGRQKTLDDFVMWDGLRICYKIADREE